MKNINIFCFGFGQVAKGFITKIKLENYNIILNTTSTSDTSERVFDGIKYQNYKFIDKKYDNNLIPKLKEADHILVSIPPKQGEDLVIKNFSNFINRTKIKWMTYLSATSVYGDHNGEWVDESSETKPSSYNGIDRLKAENYWLSLKEKKKLPLQIFRLSGIYSNENNILVRLKLGNVKLINKKNHFFSRIHIEDISNILFESLSKFKSGEIYNLSDDKPTPSEEVTLYGAKILNIMNLKKTEVHEIESEMLKNFYKDSKKVSNKKLKNLFNYNFKYPTYVEGLNYIRDNFI
jgi:nucleoside-diphosphate-sugar epimerase